MNSNTLCIVGNAKPPQDNPIAMKYVFFFITFIVDKDTGEIIDTEASTVLHLTNAFIRGLFVGHSVAQLDEEVMRQIKLTYLGSSQRAIQVAYRDAVHRYAAWKEANAENEKV